MTCIVALKTKTGFVMGADSIATDMYHYGTMVNPKIFKKGEFIIGFTNSFRFGKIIEHSFNPPKHKAGLTDDEYLNTVFSTELRKCLKDGGYTYIKDNHEEGGGALIGYHGKVWVSQDDFSVIEYRGEVIAVGSGRVPVEAAVKALKKHTKMSDEDILLAALHAVEETIISVKAPFNIIHG